MSDRNNCTHANVKRNTQFSRRKTLKVNGGDIRFVDVMPPGWETRNSVPVLFASGWAETLELLKQDIHALVRRGKRVLAIDYSHLDGMKGRREGLPASIYMKSRAFVDLISHHGLRKVDVVAHSEGAINAVVAANIAPEKINTLVLVAPGGATARDGFFGLTSRFSFSVLRKAFREARTKEERRVAFLCVKERVKYVLRNPLQAVREAVGISKFSIAEPLKRVVDAGINVCIIHSKDDIVFPIEDVRKVADYAGVNCFREVRGHHHGILMNPETFIEIIESALKHDKHGHQ